MNAALFATWVAIAAPGQMARDQVFFVGKDPHPALVALIFQRTEAPLPAVEAKLFVGWKGELRPTFWERVELPVWPGAGLEDALDAWRAVRGGRALRVQWLDGQERFEITVQTPSARGP